MPAPDPVAVTNVLLTASTNADAIEQSNEQARAAGSNAAQRSAFDVWTYTASGLEQGDAGSRDRGPSAAVAAGLGGEWASGDMGTVGTSMAAQAADASRQFQLLTGVAEPRPGEVAPEGVLGNIGATLGLLGSLEQMISTPLSAIPFPAFPAIRVTDMDVGLPHAHAHPPNLIPPAPPVPLPSTGPIIPIPLLSGASKTLINGLPAARCGDMGLGIWCGGYFPMYEVFLGSSSVWIEGARAGRVLVDITKHCIFTSPRPSDPPIGPMVGMTISSSPNVMIGGVPMPSLLNLALGALFKGLFKGLGKLARGLRGAPVVARAAQKAAESADNFSLAAARANLASRFSRQNVAAFFRRIGRNLRNPRAAFQNWVAGRRLVREVLDNGTIGIQGSSSFRRGVVRDLRTIASTPTGRQVLSDLNSSGRNVQIRDVVNAPKGQPCAVPHTPGDHLMQPSSARGKGTGSDVYYDPNQYYGRQTTPDQVLEHELGHARNNAQGTNMRNQPMSPQQQQRWTNPEEYRNITGNEAPYRAERGYNESRATHKHVL